MPTAPKILSLLTVLVAITLTSPTNAADASTSPIKTIAILTDPTPDAPSRHGIQSLKSALRAKGLTISEDSTHLDDSDLVLLTGLASARGPAGAALADLKIPPPTGPESLTIRTAAHYHNKPAILLTASDSTGLMYAALDLADRVAWSDNPSNPFQFAQDSDESPFLKERGVVMFTMNRAYFESRLHDEKFWTRYFDTLAQNRFNRLVLVFGYEDGGYMAPLYPYFFDVPGFQGVRVVGLTPEDQAKNLKSFKTMLRLAAERGIRVKPGIWEHIYRAGGQTGANPWASDASKPTPGLVWGLNTENLVPYTVAALKKFYETFPEFTETQFRMHEESGLRKSEIVPFWHDVFGFFRQNRPDILLEFRAKGLPKSVIKDAQAQGLKIQLDTKIWMEQMGLPYHPTHINRENQMDARHSYADLLEYPQTYHMNWTLWNGGTTRILLWSDPDYAHRLAESARLYDGQSLIVTEMQATKMLGAPHDTPPRDFLNPQYRYTDYEFERYWAFYRVFGRLSYNPRTSPDVWEHEYSHRFGPAAAPHVAKALQLASRVLPRVVAASVPYSMFPTTMGWAEMMHLGSLPQYARQQSGSDIQQFMNVRDEAQSILQHTDTPMRRPEETSRWFSQSSDAILAEAAAAEKALGASPATNEFKSTITDVRILAAMARYHAYRLLGGVNYNLYKLTGDLAPFDQAITNEQNAIHAWQDLVDTAADFYSDQMWFGTTGRNFPHHWNDELHSLHTDFEKLQSERKSATPRPDAKPLDPLPQLSIVNYQLSIEPSATTATPNHDFPIRVKVTAPAGIKSIRLRYRHVNQKEDYQSAEMNSASQSNQYTATIPASFIDPHWDLMYFVEIIDPQGTGRIYPDLDSQTPYIITQVQR